MTTAPPLLESLVARVGQVYSLPRVAVDVLELTSQPQVDVRRLRQVIEVDPALTAKLLRVVNSSLYGLSREVSDLNQALAVLGTKPLKLLILGFSLPDAMFADVAGDLLEGFWQHTLARAVAAREISQTCGVAGDEPFIAGLLRDLGQLVLVSELGTSYIEFWRSVSASGASVTALERHSLGFDHTQLTARLLQHWRMPAVLVEAVAAPASDPASGPAAPRSRELRHILHVAELSARLLAGRRLEVLPDLIQSAQTLLNVKHAELMAFLAALQSKVAQLADVMSVKGAGIDYAAVLREAHTRMSEAALDAAAELVRHSLEPSADALESPPVRALQETVAAYAGWRVTARSDETSRSEEGVERDRPGQSGKPTGLRCSAKAGLTADAAAPERPTEERPRDKIATGDPTAAAMVGPLASNPAAPKQPGRLSQPTTPGPLPQPSSGRERLQSGPSSKVMPRRKPDRPATKLQRPAPLPRDEWPGLRGVVSTAVAACRTARVPLSLLCLEIAPETELLFALGPERTDAVLRAVRKAGERIEHPGARWLPTHDTAFALLLPNCTKQRAVEVGEELMSMLRVAIARVASDAAASITLSAGAATISLPPKNFPAQELIDRAASSLYAARAAGGDCLKSIEIL
jgi:HD-like signal output (HDOD) protein/GGDEF domain-containing protein